MEFHLNCFRGIFGLFNFFFSSNVSQPDKFRWWDSSLKNNLFTAANDMLWNLIWFYENNERFEIWSLIHYEEFSKYRKRWCANNIKSNFLWRLANDLVIIVSKIHFKPRSCHVAFEETFHYTSFTSLMLQHVWLWSARVLHAKQRAYIKIDDVTAHLMWSQRDFIAPWWLAAV